MPGFTVPGFGALTAAHLVGYGGHAAMFALLPAALPTFTPLQLAFPYVLYALPALLLRTIQSPCTRSIPLPFSLFSQAMGFGLIAVAVVALHSQLTILLLGALLCGFGAASAQSSTVRLISRAAAGRSRGAGMHLAALEAAAAIGALAGPLIAVVLATPDNPTSHNWVPFSAVGILQAVLAIAVVFAQTTLSEPLVSDVEVREPLSSRRDRTAAPRPSRDTEESQYPPLFDWFRREIADADFSAPLRAAYESFALSFGGSMSAEERDTLIGGMRAALRRPWTWVMLTLMLISAASLSFLRPILAPYITGVRNLSTLSAALLFSLMALVGAVSETIASVTLSPVVPPRALILSGVAFSALGFTALAKTPYTTAAIGTIAAGASGALVLSMSELATETGLRPETLEDTLGTLATVVFTVGEMVGPFAAGLLREIFGSFKAAVGIWAGVVGTISICGWLAFIVAAVEKKARAWNENTNEVIPLLP